MRRRLVVLPAVLSALLVLPSTVWGGTLDQEQASGPHDTAIQSTIPAAQVFTAGLTGQLDQVDMLLGRFGTGSDLTVEIWTVTSGAPASPIPGASATVPEADVPDDGEPIWVSVPVSASSVAGTPYAIVYSTASNDTWILYGDDTGPYADLSYLSTDSGATWLAQARDFAFRTYVAVPAQPTPVASLADAAAASPEPASPLTALGFAALLMGSLGALAVANLGVVRRRG